MTESPDMQDNTVFSANTAFNRPPARPTTANLSQPIMNDNVMHHLNPENLQSYLDAEQLLNVNANIQKLMQQNDQLNNPIDGNLSHESDE